MQKHHDASAYTGLAKPEPTPYDKCVMAGELRKFQMREKAKQLGRKSQ